MRETPIVLFGIGTFHAILSMTLLPGTAFGRGFESLAIARALANSRGFADPFTPLATGPTAQLAPLYPAYLGALMRLLGDTAAMRMTAVLLTAFAFGLLLSLLPSLARRLFGSPVPGIVAAIACIAFPTFQMLPQWDAIFFAAALAGFCLLTLRSGTPLWVSGLLAGAVCLINFTGAPILIVWLAGLTIARQWLPRAAITVGLIALVVCAPWMLRNKLVLGAFSIRDDTGLELQVNNNDLAEPQFLDCWTAQRKFHPNANRKQAEAVKSLGEAKYNARKLDEALGWIRTHKLPLRPAHRQSASSSSGSQTAATPRSASASGR